MNLKRLHRIYKKIFFSDKWNIGYVTQTPEELIRTKALSGKINWLAEDPADYCADPFVLSHNGKDVIFYEHLNHWNGLGQINQINNFDFGTKKRVTGLVENLHLSYPYIFEDDNEIYCIPETARANEICLYLVNPNNLSELTRKKVLVQGAQFVDSSLIKYNGKYWLFTNKRSCSDIFIYHSDSLAGEFVPHKMNPIPTTAKNFRSGGHLFIVNDTLYRPTQNSEISYGGSLIINKISVLTEDHFACEIDFELLPSAPYTLGLHNISFGKNIIVIDGKKRSLSLLMPLKLVIRNYKLYRIKKMRAMAAAVVYAQAF
ncbi:MAG: hypothetical protein ABI415_02300 [Flavitalea sp.]